jgi:hypothetical protein
VNKGFTSLASSTARWTIKVELNLVCANRGRASGIGSSARFSFHQIDEAGLFGGIDHSVAGGMEFAIRHGMGAGAADRRIIKTVRTVVRTLASIEPGIRIGVHIAVDSGASVGA